MTRIIEPVSRGVGTRHRIIAEASQLIAERGYRETTMKAVGERVGVTEPAVYRHFESKAQLLVTVFTEAVAQSPLSRHDARGAVETLPESAALLTAADFHMLRRLIGEMYSAAAIDPDVAALARNFVTGAAERLKQGLADSIAHGELPAGMNPLYMQSFIHIFMAGLAHHEALAGDLVGDPGWALFVANAVRHLLRMDEGDRSGE
ncbi:helix-turn-helix domain-containing protein [Emcibacter sp. SYSU 3D8]|uniref:TetR/AcrR family transcriptional regulator n=1 Tax=Emcibacter sp. SYSU 3D8 TaxID=3133969 RepID=UPI0031FF2B5A